ncbi:MAG: sigma-70 family RNA polymerase sigma factor [Oscillatoriales cyanobacterium C42_A2020_001]|nr:sigma-70 family RNA polymerase sigma factor [Leptolyngbyaceae cyanobacterium C42_A2020_001]
MQPRQTVVEVFSTFVQFKADNFGGWITDPRLRRSMQQALKQEVTEASESVWALYWHKVWQTQSNELAMAHLAAYLQEVCFWVARKISLNTSARQAPADLFQTAIARIQYVLKRFNPQLSSNLKSYAEFAFSNVLKDTLRKQQEADICTDWALLQKVTQKRLVDSLEHTGLAKGMIAQYVLAWKCFKELYAATEVRHTRKLIKPEAATWQAIADLYNTERIHQLSQSEMCSPDRLEQWITNCAKAIRAFLYPTPISIDAPSTASEESPSLLERLPSNTQDSLLTDLLIEEETATRDTQLAELTKVLEGAIADLPAQTQQLLDAYYQQQLTQQQITQQLGIPQYTVSRRLSSARQTLLKKLATWSQEMLHSSLNPDVLTSMSTVLDEWLTAHYHQSASSNREYL